MRRDDFGQRRATSREAFHDRDESGGDDELLARRAHRRMENRPLFHRRAGLAKSTLTV